MSDEDPSPLADIWVSLERHRTALSAPSISAIKAIAPRFALFDPSDSCNVALCVAVCEYEHHVALQFI